MVNVHEKQRMKRLSINYDTLLRVVRGDVRVVHDELPEDAEVVNVFHDPAANAICFVVRHESFESVPFGQDLPMLWPARIELAGPSCEGLYLALLLIDRDMTVADFLQWSIEERELALDYAGLAHLSASDHEDLEVPEIPLCVAELPHCKR